MLPDRVSNPGPLTYESGALPIALRGLANSAVYETDSCVATKKRPAPGGIWCQNDVVSTSMRRNHVASTFIRRHLYVMCPAGVYCQF